MPPDDFPVGGLIGIRWREWGGGNGPFGRALSGEDPEPGSTAKRQRFERGEMVWAPDQDMLLSAFRLRNLACFSWSQPHSAHDHYRINSWFDGQPQGLHNTSIKTTAPHALHFWLGLQERGDYGFHVAAFNDDDHTEEGWTPIVGFRLGVEPNADSPFPVQGPFFDRWHELGASDGLLGKPVGAAEQFAGPGGSAGRQSFERGSLISHVAQGFDFVLSAYQVGNYIDVIWGGWESWDTFRVTAFKDGTEFTKMLVRTEKLDWARPARGSGRLRFSPPWSPPEGKATWSFVVVNEFAPFRPTPPVVVKFGQTDAPLAPLPMDTSHGQAFASHRARATAIARHYVRTRPMPGGHRFADEDSAIQLIAHLHVLAVDPEFRVPGQLPNKVLAHTLLRTLETEHGQMGTSYDEGILGSRKGDYDMAVKGLMVVVHRYRSVLAPEQVDFIVRELVPPVLPGPLNHGFESYVFITEDAPETENHLLMINSSKYLVNKLLFEKTGDQRYNNDTNGVRPWLLEWMQRFVKFDFMEFNARPYQRLSLHAILNLHEFGDKTTATGAQIVLDYVMMKFAVSSSRTRRVGPFRRLKENTNKADGVTWLFDAKAEQVGSMFRAYVGPILADGRQWEHFLDGWLFNGVIASLARYRPPPAAYSAALTQHEPVQHSFYHGVRPEMPEADEVAEGGVEIYYKSPSFLLSAGGMFLNSGYGLDELQGYAQVAIAQSTTLIPWRADADFADLVRFEPYPGDHDADGDEQLQRDAVNTGVHLGFACGANLEVPDRWRQLAGADWQGRMLLLDLNKDSLAPAAPDQPDRRLGFYLAAYRTPVADPERLRIQYGTVPRNFGWIYAIEASAMPFARFADRILTRNGVLPDKLDWGATYVFATPHERQMTFDFWMRPDQFKYSRRIFKVDGQPMVPALFTAGHLVDGVYMRSTEHEGRILIRGPGQPVDSDPLDLDFRQAPNPVRNDNAGSWPQPQRERAQAVMDFARMLLTLNPPQLQEAIDLLRSFEPPADMLAEYRTVLAETLHFRLTRFLADGVPFGEPAVKEVVDAYRLAAAIPNADVLRIARDLAQLAAQLATSGHTEDAIAAGQALVAVLVGTTPSAAADRLEHHILLAEARHNLIARLFDGNRPDEAVALAGATIQSYKDYTALADADRPRTWRDMAELAAIFARAGKGTVSADVLRALVTMLETVAPTAADRLEHHIQLAEARHNLIARLFDGNRPDEAVALAGATIQSYKDYTALADADRPRTWRDMAELAAIFARAGKGTVSADVLRALVTMLETVAPTAADRLEHHIQLAEARHNLIARLFDGNRPDEAVALAGATIQSYKDYTALADADRPRTWRDMAELAAIFARAGKGTVSADVLRALVTMLETVAPTAADRLEHHIQLAEARHNLIARLFDGNRPDEAVALAGATIQSYKDYTALADADRPRTWRDMAELAAIFARAGKGTVSADVLRALVTMLETVAPTAADRLEHHIQLAEARHNLILRLIDDDRAQQAATLVAATIDAYNHYAALPGADVARVGRDLADLAGRLSGAGLPSEAATVQAAAAELPH